MNKIILIEAMVTWQGEGPDSGKRMLLTRFKHCNRNCPYCDTKVKMDCSIEAEYSIEDFQRIITKEKLGLLITGGEPTFGGNLAQTIKLINSLNGIKTINIETNGCDLIGLHLETNHLSNIKYIFSPKLFTVNDYDNAINNVRAINDSRSMFKNLYLKLVYFNNDIVSANNDKFLQEVLNLYPDMHDNTYLMPEGKTREELIKNSSLVFDQCEEFKVNFSSRDHIIYNFI